MSPSADLPSPNDSPPPRALTKRVKKAIEKLRNKNELSEYLSHISTCHTYHLSELTSELQEKLLLQGLDQDDIYDLHNFLAIEFENGLLKTLDKEVTEARAALIQEYL
ncbi:hypothetical protein C0416_05215 [bacterium]|nr:hypothetical protein [bacterium]